jgi:hypothetical protein
MFEGFTRTEIETPGARIHLRHGATRSDRSAFSPAAFRAGGGDRLRPGRGGLLVSFPENSTLEAKGVTE